MELSTNYFELFGLQPRFQIDMASLDIAFRRLQTEMHPDRHTHGSETEKLFALQYSTSINDGYRALKHPASRAKCLMEMAGQGDTSSAVSSSFLMAQMEWREAIEEAKQVQSTDALEALAKRLKHKLITQEKELATALDERGEFQEAAQRVSEWRFYERLREEIETALDAIEI